MTKNDLIATWHRRHVDVYGTASLDDYRRITRLTKTAIENEIALLDRDERVQREATARVEAIEATGGRATFGTFAAAVSGVAR